MMSSKTVFKALYLCTAAVFLLVSAFPADAQSKKSKRGGSAESEAILPQIDVIRVKETADEALRAAGGLKRENAELRARIAELDNRIVFLSEEVSHVSAAKIEEVETRLALLTEAYKDMFVKLQALEAHIRPAPPKPPTPVPVNNAMFSTTASGELVLSSPEYDLYMSGLRLFNARSFDKAMAMFVDCLAKFPDGEYRDRSNFWIGECHYQMGRMAEAIAAYSKVLTYKNSTKADAAQFQIALAHQKLGQTELARAEFRRLIERYPASAFVERSKRYLEDLK
ncbi:MAG: tetratricopeptide repeat protein [Chitinispirillia bacterium]|nr:tetratricopeptide repeat protein [Chitinispirillia bacterium]MCL2242434.1 tetratricopeptide repeat protein [Chitinispirillia bacterium]